MRSETTTGTQRLTIASKRRQAEGVSPEEKKATHMSEVRRIGRQKGSLNRHRYIDAIGNDDRDAQVDYHVEETAGRASVAWGKKATRYEQGAEIGRLKRSLNVDLVQTETATGTDRLTIASKRRQAEGVSPGGKRRRRMSNERRISRLKRSLNVELMRSKKDDRVAQVDDCVEAAAGRGCVAWGKRRHLIVKLRKFGRLERRLHRTLKAASMGPNRRKGRTGWRSRKKRRQAKGVSPAATWASQCQDGAKGFVAYSE